MKTLGIVGARGLVGESFLNVLANKNLDLKVKLFGNTSAGKKIEFRGKRLTVQPCENIPDAQLDYAVFAASGLVSSKYIPTLANNGTVCIDNSSYFRLKKDVPLIVTCINGEEIGGNKIIANPNCSTIQTAIVINALKSLEPTKLVAVTYQAVSGAGREGVYDLKEQRGYGNLKQFEHPIANNIIPHIGQTTAQGLTSEEWKMVKESKKILNLPRLKVNAFCCRVPVTRGHGVFVNLTFRKKPDLDEVKELLRSACNVLVMDGDSLYPMPINIANTKYVGVGRIVRDPSNPKAVNMFVAADNLLRGAAYNAYEILEYVVKREEQSE